MTTITVAATAVVDAATAAAALVAAGYTITPPAVVIPPPPPPPVSVAPVLTVVFAQNGAVNPAWTQTYDYSATDARNDTVDGGDGNAACIKVTTTGPWGGFQPSNNNGVNTDCSKVKTLTVAVKAPKGNSYSVQFLRGGDVAINSPGFLFTKTTNDWETYSWAKALSMTDASLGDVSAEIFKGAVQSKQAAAGDIFLVDNWGGI